MTLKRTKKESEKCVLIVDDTPVCQESLKLQLQALLPYKIIVTSNGEEGLEYLQKNRANVVLILSDITMPGITGLEFLSIVQKDPLLKKIPVILQSSLDEEESARELGASDYLRKPYTNKALKVAIDKIKKDYDCFGEC